LTNVCEKRPIQEKKKETNPSETPALAFARVLARALAHFLACAHALVSIKKMLMCVERDL